MSQFLGVWGPGTALLGPLTRALSQGSQLGQRHPKTHQGRTQAPSLSDRQDSAPCGLPTESVISLLAALSSLTQGLSLEASLSFLPHEPVHMAVYFFKARKGELLLLLLSHVSRVQLCATP